MLHLFLVCLRPVQLQIALAELSGNEDLTRARCSPLYSYIHLWIRTCNFASLTLTVQCTLYIHPDPTQCVQCLLFDDRLTDKHLCFMFKVFYRLFFNLKDVSSTLICCRVYSLTFRDYNRIYLTDDVMNLTYH